MRMPFGKFKGTEIDEIKPQYLQWLLENIPLREPLRTAVFEVMETMPGPDKIAMPATQKVKGIYRELSMKYHPDRGGSKEAMQAVNEFYGKLR
jgi:hypothetical protein